MNTGTRCAHLGSLVLMLCCLSLTGCGGGGEEDVLDSLYEEGGSSGIAPVSDTEGGNSVAPTVDKSMLAEAARKATECLNGMSGEYEGFFQSGQARVELKRTEELYQIIEPVSQRVSNSPAPPLTMAEELKTEVLPPLLDAIKRADLAELHFRREYTKNNFGYSPFSKTSHEIHHGIRAARGILDKIQHNIPVANRLTTGPPPVIGGPPPTNRSFGYLRSLGVAPTTYQNYQARGVADAIPWRMMVDPPAQPYQLEPEETLDLEAAGADVNATTFYNPVNVLYPVMASTHVGLGLNEAKGQQRLIWSLSPRLRKGVVKGIQLQKSDIMALSADGQYFAARPERTSIIGLFDVKKGAAVGQIDFEFAAGGNERLFFGVDNRLLVFDGRTLTAWSVPNLKQEYVTETVPVTLRSPWHPGYGWSVSPGGRYLALPSNYNSVEQVQFYDLTTGEAAANLFPSGQISSRFLATSFSKDGTKLAVLIDGYRDTKIEIWDIASGRISASFTKDAALSSAVNGDSKYQGPSVDWFPDGRRILLYGKGVFDTETGQGTRLISSTVRYPVKPIGGDNVAVVMNKKFVTYDLNQFPANPVRWTTESLKNEVVAADNPFAVVQQGGKPSASETDRSSVEYCTAPANRTWVATADPQQSSLSSSSTLSIPGFSNEHVYHAALAANHSRIVVGYTNESTRIYNGKVSDLESLKSWVEFSDLTPSGSRQKHEMPFPCGLQAISPDGTHFLTRSFEGFNRIDIWKLDSGTHVVGLIPYLTGRSDGGAAVLWADFVDESHILTLSASQLTCWSIPDGKAIYEVSISDLTGWPIFSPGRNQLALLSQSGALSLIHSLTGEFLGQIEKLNIEGDLKTCSFRADGQELAILSEPAGGGIVSLLDITTGEISKSFPIPLTGNELEWCDDEYLLIDGGYCISLEKNAVAWIFNLDGVRVASGSSPVKYFLSKKTYNDPHTLMSRVLPGEEIQRAVEMNTPPNEVVLAEGGSLALDIQIPSPPGRSNFSEEVKTSLVNKFGDFGITISPSASLTLVVRGSQGKTGEGISLSRFGGWFDRGVEIDEERVRWTLSIKEENQTLWQRTSSANNTGSVKLDEGASGQAAISQAEQKLRENMWNSAADKLLRFEIPKYVFGPDAGKGLGSTKLGE